MRTAAALLAAALVAAPATAFRPAGHRHRHGRLPFATALSATTAAAPLVLRSPAKINLFLRILSRRDDGYHELSSCFQAVGLCDELSFSPLPAGSSTDELTCDLEGVPLDATNLVVKAFDIWRDRTGETTRFKVHLDKSVPVQAGLGGGSSNAATALYAANALCGSPATQKELEDMSAVLGSDLTFFLGSRGTAMCTGRGEVIDPLPPLPPHKVTLVKPEVGCPTGKVFTTLDVASMCAHDKDPGDLLRGLYGKGVANAELVNDLEPPAFLVAPELAAIKAELEGCGFDAVLMSGSGSTIFCLGEASEDPGLERYAAAHPEMFVHETEFVSRSGDSWY